MGHRRPQLAGNARRGTHRQRHHAAAGLARVGMARAALKSISWPSEIAPLTFRICRSS